MGTQLNDIVQVNITRETAKITQAGFGTALIFGALTEFTERYRIYNSIEAVEEDFETGSEQWKAAAALFSQEVSPEQVVIGDRDTTEALGDELAAMQAAYGDWYALILTRQGDEAAQLADIAAAAQWIEARNKIYIAGVGQESMLTSADTDIASTLKAAAYERTAVMYSADHANYPEAAWMGRCLPEDPGSITWKFKQLSGITVDDLTSTEVACLRAKNANFYEQVAGYNMISGEAVMASGEFIDIMRGTDWLQARIAEGVFFRMINADKIPFTTQGISVIENELRYRLEKGVDVGLLVADSIVITPPVIADVDPLEKSQRFLDNMQFTARLAGAVHKVAIVGTLTL
jgi:hypothetical protein